MEPDARPATELRRTRYPGPIKEENWRGNDGEMQQWMKAALRSSEGGGLLRVTEFADRMYGRVLARAEALSDAREALEDYPCRCICDKCDHEHPWETCEVNMSQSQGPNRRDFPKPCGCKRFYGRATDDAPGNCKKCKALAKLEALNG